MAGRYSGADLTECWCLQVSFWHSYLTLVSHHFQHYCVDFWPPFWCLHAVSVSKAHMRPWVRHWKPFCLSITSCFICIVAFIQREQSWHTDRRQCCRCFKARVLQVFSLPSANPRKYNPNLIRLSFQVWVKTVLYSKNCKSIRSKSTCSAIKLHPEILRYMTLRIKYWWIKTAFSGCSWLR